MQDSSDFRQKAVCKCLEQRKLNPANPYKGPYYNAAYRSAKCEAYRRQASQERRMSSFLKMSPCRERYLHELRYMRDGLNSDDPAKVAEAREELDLQRQAIEKLAANDKAIIVQCDLLALPTVHVALSRGETLAAVRGRQFHARRRLRNHLNDIGVAAG